MYIPDPYDHMYVPDMKDWGEEEVAKEGFCRLGLSYLRPGIKVDAKENNIHT